MYLIRQTPSIIKEVIFSHFSKKEIINLIFLSVFSFAFVVSLFYTQIFGLLAFLIVLIASLFGKKKDFLLEFSILIILIISTNVFEFGSLEQLPFLQLGPGLRFNLLDILILLTFLRYFGNVINDKQATTKNFMLFNIILATIYVLVGFAMTGSPREAGFNYYRVFFYFGSYVMFYTYMRDIRNFKRLLFVLSIWVISMTSVQIIEFFQDYRFTFPGVKPLSDFYSTEGFKIQTAGQEKLYTWSRVTGLAFLILPFTLSFYITTSNRFYLITFIFTLSTFILALSRIWFLGIVIVFLTVIIYLGIKKLSKVFAAILFIITALLLIQFYSLEFMRFDFFAALLGRTQSIVTLGRTYGEMDTFSVRVMLFLHSFNKFLESPLIGHGFGQSVWNVYYSLDLGAVNRLFMMGLLGLLPILGFIITRIFRVIREINLSKDINLKTIYVALLAFILAHFPMYLWQIDFYGSNYIIHVMLVYALYDSIFRFNQGVKI